MSTTEKTSYGKIVTHSSIYILGIFISKIIGFIMIPIYTNYLTPADYGVLEILTMTTDVIAFIIGAGLAQAVLRFYYHYDTIKERNETVSTALIAGLVIFVTIFGSLIFISDKASELVFGSAEYGHYFTIIFICMTLFSGIEIPMVYLRAQQRSAYFVLINLVKLVIQLTLNIYFLVVLEMGVVGILYSLLISNILIAGYLIIKTFAEIGIKFSYPKFIEQLRFGFPLVFTSIGAFIITYSDRYFLRYFTDLNEVGLYSLGYKFGMLVSALFIAPFQQYWTAEMFAVAKRDDAQKVFRDFFTYSTFASVIICLAISVYIKEGIEIMAMESYWSAYRVVALICLAYIFMGMYGFVNCGILIKKQTKYLAYSTAFSVVTNIGLNFLLIPYWGSIGAATATIGSFLVRFGTALIYSQRLYYIKYDWKRVINVLVLGALFVLISGYIKFDSLILTLAVKTVLLPAYFIVLFILGWFNNREKELIFMLLKNPIRSVKSGKSFWMSALKNDRV